jgi:hypothetical protein
MSLRKSAVIMEGGIRSTVDMLHALTRHGVAMGFAMTCSWMMSVGTGNTKSTELQLTESFTGPSREVQRPDDSPACVGQDLMHPRRYAIQVAGVGSGYHLDMLQDGQHLRGGVSRLPHSRRRRGFKQTWYFLST